MMNFKKNKRLWTVLGLLFLVISLYVIIRNTKYVEHIIMSAGAWGPLVTVLIYAIFSATPVSTDPLTVISGALFGPLLGIFVAWAGNNLAALVEYYIGMKIGNATNFEEKKDNLPFGLSKMPVDSFLFLTLGRIVPGYGSKVVSIMCGMYRVPLKKYILAAMLTNLLGAALLSIGGSALIHLLKV